MLQPYSTQNNQAVERAAFGGFFALEIWIQYNSDNLLPTVSIYVLFIFCGGVWAAFFFFLNNPNKTLPLVYHFFVHVFVTDEVKV